MDSSTVVKKPKHVYTIDDVRKNDVELLALAESTPPKGMFCFGPAWFKLFSLELIDDESRVTPLGSQLLAAYHASLQ